FIVIGGAALTALLASCVALGPVVRSRAEKVAREHGMTIDIGHVWPGFGGVRLTNVRFRAGQPDWMAGEPRHGKLRGDLTVGQRSCSWRGGGISIAGSLDEVAEHARALMKTGDRDASRSSGKSDKGPELSVEDVSVVWAGPFERSSVLEIDQVHGERTRSRDG